MQGIFLFAITLICVINIVLKFFQTSTCKVSGFKVFPSLIHLMYRDYSKHDIISYHGQVFFIFVIVNVQ